MTNERKEFLRPKLIDSRLDELRALKDGWLEGEGKAPSQEGLVWLSETLTDFFPDDLPLPRLYPTPAGGVQAEWPFGDAEAILEIDVSTRTGRWHYFDPDTDEESEKQVTLDESLEWEWLTCEIRRLAEAAA